MKGLSLSILRVWDKKSGSIVVLGAWYCVVLWQAVKISFEVLDSGRSAKLQALGGSIGFYMKT